MNRKEHLLTILAEECAEVAQRASKALRFGLDEVQPGQPLSNAERILDETFDLIAVYEILVAEGHLPQRSAADLRRHTAMKIEKIEKFLDLSKPKGKRK